MRSRAHAVALARAFKRYGWHAVVVHKGQPVVTYGLLIRRRPGSPLFTVYQQERAEWLCREAKEKAKERARVARAEKRDRQAKEAAREAFRQEPKRPATVVRSVVSGGLPTLGRRRR